MSGKKQIRLQDTGERMIPAGEGEVSYVFARHSFAYDQAVHFTQSKRVIDIGCGTGYGSNILAAGADAVLGIDYDSDAIEYCRTNFNAPNLSFVRMDAGSLSFNKEFDVAVSFQVIEHMPDLHNFLDGIIRAVRRGGTILLTTPNARVPVNEQHANPFHMNEMNFDQFRNLLSDHFASFELLGIGYASSNRLRTLIQRSPLYRLGKYMNRKNPVKKLANAAMSLTEFTILQSDIARDAIDLFAVCQTD